MSLGLNDPKTLLPLAATGDRAAQATLASLAIEWGNQGLIAPIEAWTTADIFARMAASQGKPTDIHGLAGVLLMRAGWERQNGRLGESVTLQAEAVQLLDKLADAGSEEATTMLMAAGRVCDPNAFQIARDQPLVHVDVKATEAKAAAMTAAGDPDGAALGLIATFHAAFQATNDASAAEMIERSIANLRQKERAGEVGVSLVLDAIRRGLETD